MADVPKSFKLTGVTVSTNFATVPADKAWIIKSAMVFGNTSSTDVLALRIGGDDISGAIPFTSGTNQALDLLQPGGSSANTNEHSRTIIASAAEVVRLEFKTGSTAKNARLSVIEIDV